MIRAVIFSVAVLFAGYAAAAEMTTPHVVLADVDWQTAAASLGEPANFDALNAAAAGRFPGIVKSPVPVLLPFDKDVLAGFQATAFFQPGPAGYDTAFALRTADVSEFADIGYAKPVYVLMSGLRFTYDLDGPALPEGQPVKELDSLFPGIRRTLHEFYVRYSFTRYGVTYVASIFCRDTRPRAKILTCHQADRIAERFLRALKLAGGSPDAPGPAAALAPVARPQVVSPDFSYYSPGSLIPGTGRKPDVPGRNDTTVYAQLRFPLQNAPAFANSQSFNNWGDCDFTGREPRRLGTKGMAYRCRVNGRPLVFDEAAGRNYSYPWRDNFCEHRNFAVGQCPAGEGHQGQDIRPAACAQTNQGADRCEPYRDAVVAVQDGMILRAPKQEAVFLFVNRADAHVRVRYMHMSPRRLDADGVLSGMTVRAGDRLGMVGNFNDYARGTTYHLHFDMQVPTKIGWVFVNPYMTLVAAYEQLIGARGSEIGDGEPEPAVAAVPPVFLQPTIAQGHREASAGAASVKLPEPRPPAAGTQKVEPRKAVASTAIHMAKSHKDKPRKKAKRKRHQRKHLHEGDE